MYMCMPIGIVIIACAHFSIAFKTLLSSVPEKPLEVVKAVHTFSTKDPGRLSVEAGDILLVLQKDVQAEDGWWLVKRERDNSQGLVPSLCLQPVPPECSPPEPGIQMQLLLNSVC